MAGGVFTCETLVEVVVGVVDQAAVSLIEAAQAADAVAFAVHGRPAPVAGLTQALVQALGQRSIGDLGLEIGRQSRVAVALKGRQDVAPSAVGEQRRRVAVAPRPQGAHFVGHCASNKCVRPVSPTTRFHQPIKSRQRIEPSLIATVFIVTHVCSRRRTDSAVASRSPDANFVARCLNKGVRPTVFLASFLSSYSLE